MAKKQNWQVTVKEFVHPDFNSNMSFPVPRTYHAATLVDRFMIIVGGESNSSDLNDLWALDLDAEKWHKPNIVG